MKKIAIILLILGVIIASIPKNVVSIENEYMNRYNDCYIYPIREVRISKGVIGHNKGWICQTDKKVCYLMEGSSPILLYCENK